MKEPFKINSAPQVLLAIKQLLEKCEVMEAASVMLENQDLITPWWLDWAFKIRAGLLNPILPSRSNEALPLWRDGDLFGEPIKTRRKSRKRTKLVSD